MAASVRWITAEQRMLYADRAKFTDTLPGVIRSGETIHARSNPSRHGVVLCYVPGRNLFPSGYLLERYEDGVAAGWADWLPAWDTEADARRSDGQV